MIDHSVWFADEYRVLVAADRFDEDVPDQRALKDYAGARIRLPANQSHRLQLASEIDARFLANPVAAPLAIFNAAMPAPGANAVV